MMRKMTKQRKRIILKINLYKEEKDLYMDMIYNIHPDKRLLLLHHHAYYIDIADATPQIEMDTLIPVTIPDPTLFNRIKFEWIKWIKTDPNPENRVADFEWRDSNGLPDFKKLDKLIHSRKTIDEKQKEIDEELALIKEMDRLGVDSGPSKEYLKQLIRGPQ